MVRSRVDIEENSVRLIRNIESFLLLEMGRHNVDYAGKQKFKLQLYYAMFILHQRDDEDIGNICIWVSAWDLFESENDTTRMINSFKSHGAMYARVLFNFYPSYLDDITHIERFFDGADNDNTNMEGSSSSVSSRSSSSTVN